MSDVVNETGNVVVDVIRILDKNKAKFAFLAPFVTTCAGVLVTWIVSGVFNGQEIREAVAGVVTSAVAAFAAWLAPAQQAVVEWPHDSDVGADISAPPVEVPAPAATHHRTKKDHPSSGK